MEKLLRRSVAFISEFKTSTCYRTLNIYFVYVMMTNEFLSIKIYLFFTLLLFFVKIYWVVRGGGSWSVFVMVVA